MTLSEDHAYESHTDTSGVRQTCEIAIPGNTKAQRAKRGQDTNKTFAEARSTGSTDSTSATTTSSSWLYMGEKPVLCDNVPMMLAAAMGNVNCLIQKNGRKLELYSQQLLLI